MNPLLNNNGNTMREFIDFVRQMQGANPQEVLNNLMASGRYTQAELDEAKRKAEQFLAFMK